MFTTEQQHFNGDVSRPFDYSQEFRSKVSFNYGSYIFLSPKKEVYLYDIVEFAKTELYGFEAYRTVFKGEHIIHIYMKFLDYNFAQKAKDAFKSHQASHLHVASVQDMLEAMYFIESTERTYPLWTSAIVDTVGEVPSSLAPQEEHFSSVLNACGQPRLYDFQWKKGRLRSVSALYSSMAEALGASIVLGEWVNPRNPSGGYYYRVRIIGGDKEIMIFRHLQIPNVNLVFDMEYFVGGESHLFTVPPNQMFFVQPTLPPEFYYPSRPMQYVPAQQQTVVHPHQTVVQQQNVVHPQSVVQQQSGVQQQTAVHPHQSAVQQQSGVQQQNVVYPHQPMVHPHQSVVQQQNVVHPHQSGVQQQSVVQQQNVGYPHQSVVQQQQSVEHNFNNYAQNNCPVNPPPVQQRGTGKRKRGSYGNRHRAQNQHHPAMQAPRG